jgi:hypothetical protein
MLGAFGRPGVHQRLAVLRHESIEPDSGTERFHAAVEHRRDHLSAVGMAAQNDVVELFHVEHAENVVDMTFEIDTGARQMGAVTETGQSRGEDRVALRAEDVRHPAPAPAAVPRAVYQQIGRHVFPSRLCHPLFCASGILRVRRRRRKYHDVSGFAG